MTIRSAALPLLFSVVVAVVAPRPAHAQTCTATGVSDAVTRLGTAKTHLAPFGGAGAVLDWSIGEATQAAAPPSPGAAEDVARALLDVLGASSDWDVRLESAALRLDGLAQARRKKADAGPAGAAATALRDEADALVKAAAALRPAVPSRTLTVTGHATVAIVLTNPPTTRARLSFDRVETGAHHEVEWDPAIDAGLARRVTLAAGTWSVSPSIEPTFVQQGAGSIVIAAPFTGFRTTTGPFVLTATHTALVADKAVTRTDADQVLMTGWPRPTLTLTCLAAPPSIEDETFGASAPAGADARAFGTAPEIVTETLSILAEIAVDRARAGAMKLLADRFVVPLCGNGADRPGVTLHQLGLQPATALVLPRTCELLTALRLEDVLASGDAVLRALRDDLRLTIAPALLERTLAHRPVAPVARALLGIASSAIDRGSFSDLDARLALGLLADFALLVDLVPTKVGAEAKAEVVKLLTRAPQPLRDRVCKKESDLTRCAAAVFEGKGTLGSVLTTFAALPPKASEVKALRDALAKDLAAAVLADADSDVAQALRTACHVRLAVAVVKRCTAGGCSADEIAAILRAPHAHFAEDTVAPANMCWDKKQFVPAPAALGSLHQLVLDGIELSAPVRQTSGRDRAVAAVRLLVTVVRQIDRSSPEIELFGDLAIALVEERYDTALATAIRFLGRVGMVERTERLRELRKISQLVGAVTAYVTVYRNTKDADPAAARTARKQALEALIDSATDRRGRERDAILSIGSNVGLGATWTGVRNDDGNLEYLDGGSRSPSLRVPLGLVYQRPREKGSWGLHLGFQLVDLGQFVARGEDGAVDDPRWSTFIAPGVEIGASVRIPESSTVLNLSLHTTYAPGLFEEDDAEGGTSAGAWRVGLHLGYYVPFFDLN